MPKIDYLVVLGVLRLFHGIFYGTVKCRLRLHECRKWLRGSCGAAVTRDQRAHTQHIDLSTFACISSKLSQALIDEVTDPWTFISPSSMLISSSGGDYF